MPFVILVLFHPLLPPHLLPFCHLFLVSLFIYFIYLFLEGDLNPRVPASPSEPNEENYKNVTTPVTEYPSHYLVKFEQLNVVSGQFI